ncbi:short-chain dehydrogenase [Halobacteriales archaeon QS_1_68_17]|nr:MAG: short-chain dehydrogenase [Halobacteriales archaeon QS_1_68_17]
MARTVLVTGASRGIGAGVARAFAADGAHVVVCARDRDRLEATVESIREAGGRVTPQRADVRDEFDVERLVETAARVEDGAGIDLVVANAGVYHGEAGHTPMAEESYAAFDDHLRTNGRGVFATIREAVPHLAPEARVLVLSGSVARETKAGFGSYAVSKATAEAVARGFAAELDRAVGIVDPGQVDTDLTDQHGRDPDDVAPMLQWAADELAAEELDGAVVSLADWKRATR